MIIGITGKKQVGKSTVSKYLQKFYNFTELNFADSLKKGLKEIFNLTDEQLNGTKKEQNIEKYGCCPRELMQWFGTDIIRNQFSEKFPLSPPIWVDNTEMQIIKLIEQKKNIVISDIRFQNEADLIKKYGGIIIKIKSDYSIKYVNENTIKKKYYNFSDQKIIQYSTKIRHLKNNIEVTFDDSIIIGPLNYFDIHESEQYKIEYNYSILNKKNNYNTNYLKNEINKIMNIIIGNYEENLYIQ